MLSSTSFLLAAFERHAATSFLNKNLGPRGGKPMPTLHKCLGHFNCKSCKTHFRKPVFVVATSRKPYQDVECPECFCLQKPYYIGSNPKQNESIFNRTVSPVTARTRKGTWLRPKTEKLRSRGF
eukprot:PhM_4_TR11239/c0_g1_i1/m.74054